MSEGVKAEEKSLVPAENPFLPKHFVLRDVPVLARRVETKEEAAALAQKVGAEFNPGDWMVIDDRGVAYPVEHDEFSYFYKENKGGEAPGKINIQLPGGMNGIGCAAVTFKLTDDEVKAGKTLADDFNDWFARPEHFGYMVVDRHYFSETHAILFVTKVLSDRELQERREVNQIAADEIKKRRDQAADNQMKAIEEATKYEREREGATAKELAELAELAEEGRKHLANCKKEKAKKGKK